MKRIYILPTNALAIIITGYLLTTSAIAAPEVQPLVLHQPKSKETVQEFTERYGPKQSDLIIEKVSVHDAAAAADFPIRYEVQAKVLKPGEYIFTFDNMDDRNFTFETRKIRLRVGESFKDKAAPKQLETISPEDENWKMYFRGQVWTRPGAPLLIQWHWNPGGEGFIGGWFLSKIEGKTTSAKPE